MWNILSLSLCSRWMGIPHNTKHSAWREEILRLSNVLLVALDRRRYRPIIDHGSWVKLSLQSCVIALLQFPWSIREARFSRKSVRVQWQYLLLKTPQRCAAVMDPTYLWRAGIHRVVIVLTSDTSYAVMGYLSGCGYVSVGEINISAGFVARFKGVRRQAAR